MLNVNVAPRFTPPQQQALKASDNQREGIDINAIVPFRSKKRTLNDETRNFNDETRNFIIKALKSSSKIPETPDTPESEVRRRISRLPETEIKSILSDVPVRSNGEPLSQFVERALPRYEALEQYLKAFKLEELCEETQKKIKHFYLTVAALRKLSIRILQRLIE